MDENASFMELVVEKLKEGEGKAYKASNGIILFLDKNDTVWYYMTEKNFPFTIAMLQDAREQLLYG